MQFKHPEVLWALMLLLIPILIHLFQLRRFKHVAFTNVKYLKRVELQTRKSSQLKKWLTLLARLFLLACAIIAFAQPFTSKTGNYNTKNELVIYVDNSFSMEAKGTNGSLLNEVLQDIIKRIPDDDNITIFTNDKTFEHTTLRSIANDLIELHYTSTQLDYNTAYVKGQQFFSEDKTTSKHLVLVSDFQQHNETLQFQQDTTIALSLVQPKAVYNNNISLDSVYVSNTTPENIELTVTLSSQNNPENNIPVALFNTDTLVAKMTTDSSTKASTTFTIPRNKWFKGRIAIEDAGLHYDNQLYFNINKTENINVLSINGVDDTFLKKLYTDDEFEYLSFDFNDINYNRIAEQQLIILNELNTIPNALITALKALKNNGGSILIIPSETSELDAYNQLFRALSFPKLHPLQSIEKRVTTINYDHPLLANSFYDRVDNFQYPKVNAFYPLASPSNSVYSFEDGQPLLIGADQVYLFTASLQSSNGNFKKSPLIVPALYNLGKHSLRPSQLYYTIGHDNSVDIKATLDQDAILKLENDTESVIPLQQTFRKKVRLTTDVYPKSAGIFDVKKNNTTLKQLSFNHQRSESNLRYHDTDITDVAFYSTDFTSVIDRIKNDSRTNALWRWFVIFALLFLMTEMLLLKYLK